MPVYLVFLVVLLFVAFSTVGIGFPCCIKIGKFHVLRIKVSLIDLVFHF